MQFIKKGYLMKNEIEELIEFFIETNRKIITDTGGVLGIVDRGNLYFSIYDASKRMNCEITENEVALSAARLFYNLAYKAHAFRDGNKRTSFMATKAWCLINGFELEMDYSSDSFQFVLEVAAGKKSLSEIASHLLKHLKKSSIQSDILVNYLNRLVDLTIHAKNGEKHE